MWSDYTPGYIKAGLVHTVSTYKFHHTYSRHFALAVYLLFKKNYANWVHSVLSLDVKVSVYSKNIILQVRFCSIIGKQMYL